MSQVIIVDTPQIFLEALGFIAFWMGFFLKGTLMAMLGDLVTKPLARHIEHRMELWSVNHPNLLHFYLNHKGLKPSKCLIGRCQEIQ